MLLDKFAFHNQTDSRLFPDQRNCSFVSHASSLLSVDFHELVANSQTTFLRRWAIVGDPENEQRHTSEFEASAD
jgi:hypothetical protein